MLRRYLLLDLFIVSLLNFFLFFFMCLSAHFSSGHLSRVKREHLGPHDWVSMPVPGGHEWMVVPGLEPETTYQFSILAQNKLGTGPFSEVVTVNTLGEWHTTARAEPRASNMKTSLAGIRLRRLHNLLLGKTDRHTKLGRACRHTFSIRLCRLYHTFVNLEL